MTHNEALDILAEYTEDTLSGIMLPVRIQKGDTEITERAPDIYKMRLPNGDDAKKVAPYVIVRYVQSLDKQTVGRNTLSTAVFRFIFCVYDDDESKGAVNLLNVMETLKTTLLRDVSIDKKIRLVKDEGLEMIAYEDDTRPYFAGEIIGTFQYAAIEREVQYDEENY